MMDVALSSCTEARGKFKKCLHKGYNHYRVFLFELVDWDDTVPLSVQNRGEFVAIGDDRIPEISAFNFRLFGRWHRNAKRGGEMQFKVASFSEVAPVSKDGILKVLACGIYKGIGPKTAERIYDRFGKDSLRVLNEETYRLREVKGIGAVMLSNLVETVRETVELRELAELLAVYDVTPHKMRQIQKKFPENACKLIKEDPFRLCEISGFGFKISDDIATKVGTPMCSPLRIQAAIGEILKANNGYGNLYAPAAVVIKKALVLLNNRPGDIIGAEAVETELQAMQMESRVKLDQDAGGRDVVYRHEDYLNEINAAKRMIELLRQPIDARLTLNGEQMREEIAGAEKEFGITFAPKQKEAIKSALRNKVCIITGGPGTGKTTILRAILWIYRRITEKNYDPDKQPQTLPLAPTGKAARRMTESARQKAFTIHKGLGITPASFTPHDPLLTDATGIVFIDEASMADMKLWARLVAAIPAHTQLVMIGDVDQLPSVSPGAVLRDMIESGVIPVTRLDVIYRQGEESRIVGNAHKIRVGDAYLTYCNSEFAFFPFPDKEENPKADEDVQEKIISLYLRAIQKYGIQETLILCPRREQVTASSYVLNERIQALLHGQNPDAQRFSAAGKLLYVGDRIIQTGTGDKAANGDTGIIVSARPDPDQEGGWVADIRFDFMEPGDTVEYSGGDFEHIQLGYSLTIHKSQGSEAKAVFIPVLQSQIHVLNRNTLYTGVTRAKEFVGLFGQAKALAMGIRKKHTTLTMFADRLRREFEKERDECHDAVPCDIQGTDARHT